MTSLWQGLGAFVHKVEDLSSDQLMRFRAAGGSWIVVLVKGDPLVVPENLQRLQDLQTECKAYGIQVGGWFNCFGGSIEKDAAEISGQAEQLKPVVLDLEEAYKFSDKFSGLVALVRNKIGPAWPLGVSTNEMNESMDFSDFFHLGVRLLPQWYSWIYAQDGSYRPDKRMKWVKDNGHIIPQLRDPHGPHQRGLPLSYVHGTLEATGMESADLVDEISWVHASQVAFGYTKGVSLYTLESAPTSDLALLSTMRGKLFLS